MNKVQTITIDAKCREFYYQAPVQTIAEEEEEKQHRQIFWNYMMNVSMQNTIAQIVKVN